MCSHVGPCIPPPPQHCQPLRVNKVCLEPGHPHNMLLQPCLKAVQVAGAVRLTALSFQYRKRKTGLLDATFPRSCQVPAGQGAGSACGGGARTGQPGCSSAPSQAGPSRSALPRHTPAARGPRAAPRRERRALGAGAGAGCSRGERREAERGSAGEAGSAAQCLPLPA